MLKVANYVSIEEIAPQCNRIHVRVVCYPAATLVSMTHKPIELAPRVLSWASIIDQNTADQAAGLGQLDFVSPHIALMPDAHGGKGTAIGTVIPTKGL